MAHFHDPRNDFPRLLQALRQEGDSIGRRILVIRPPGAHILRVQGLRAREDRIWCCPVLLSRERDLLDVDAAHVPVLTWARTGDLYRIRHFIPLELAAGAQHSIPNAEQLRTLAHLPARVLVWGASPRVAHTALAIGCEVALRRSVQEIHSWLAK